MNNSSTTILRRTLASAVIVFGVLGFFGAAAASAAPVTLQWTPNSEPTLAGYLVSYGTAPGQYATTVDVGNTPTFAMQTPSDTTVYYFAVQAYDTEGQQSGYSAEVSTAGLVPALRVTALTANRVAPQAPGTAVTFTAAVTGGTAPYAYKFWLLSDTTPWTVVQAWSSTATFTWTPATPSNYQVAVWVRSAGSTVDASEGATGMGTMAFRVAAAPVTLTATLTAAKASPQAVGTALAVTAAATGGTAPYAYKFWIMSSVAGWSIAQDWSASPTFAWTPSVAATYQIAVWIRNAGSTRDSSTEGSAGLGFQITGAGSPLTLARLTPSRPSPQAAGTALTVTTGATGGTAPYAYKFWIMSSVAPWTIAQDWSASPTLSWTPSVAATYQVTVWVRSAGSTRDASTEGSTGLAFVITAPGAPLAVTSLTTNRPAPQVAGTAITVATGVTGGTGPAAYKFWVLSDTAPWTMVQTWSPSATFVWTPAASGTYQVAVWARSAGSTVDAPETATAVRSIAYTVSPTP